MSQGRSISADASPGTNASASAVDFGTFNAQVTSGNASASQNSVIDTTSITASGAATGGEPPNTNLVGVGRSDFSVTFDLATPSTYTLSGSLFWAFSGGASFAPNVSLSSTDGTVFQMHGFNANSEFGTTVSFSTYGGLPSGRYTLEAHAQGAFYRYESGNYDMTFSVGPSPCAQGECQSGLLGYWTFDEGSGSTAGDSSTNMNTGTVLETGTNSISWVGGVVGGALHFDNQTQVIVPHSPSLNAFGGITISAWVKADYWGSAGYAPRILEKGNSGNQYALFSTASGQLEFLLSGVSNGVLIANAPSPGDWHLLTATFNGSSMTLYIDGLVAAQQSATGPLALTSDALAIGSAPSGSVSNMFSGAIDDVRIYGHALSGSEITQLYTIDSVGDGIPNLWRAQYFGTGSLTGSASCATCDFDGTGQNNLFKYVAGLDPTNPSSTFGLTATLISTDTLSDALIASYPFDGNLTNDVSGGGHNGTAVGGVTLTKDRFGNANSALNCDGTSGYIWVPTTFTRGDVFFTWSVWFRPGSAATNLAGNLLNEGGSPGAGNTSPSIGVNSSPGVIDFFKFSTSTGGSDLLSQTRAQWDTNAWYHVAITCDGSGNRCLYVNGVCENSDNNQQLGQFNRNFYIGASASYNASFFFGDIDDVRIYGRQLSAQEIQQLYTVLPTPTARFRLQYGPLFPGRTYTPQFSTDLVSGVWLPLSFIDAVTSNNQVSIIDTNSSPPVKFYRIDISKP